MIKKYLYKFGMRLVEKYGEPAPIIEPIKPQFVPEIAASVLTAASEIVERLDQVEASGEFKRHSALAEMMKRFPSHEKRVLCLAIELSVWGCGVSNDNFILGDSKAVCDSCGFHYKQSELRKRWDGAMVCAADFESRHPQDLIKARGERNHIKDARPEPAYRFLGTNEITAGDL